MRTKLSFLLGLLLGVGLMTAAQAQRAKDSVIVDPDVHKVILENEHVRVLDARVSPGTRSAMHSHPPMVLVSLGGGRFKVTGPDKKTQILDFNPGMVIWRESTEHSWEMLSGQAHVIAVEVKSANKTSGQ
jgi:quercetin dioxygenase-like cupin family protein